MGTTEQAKQTVTAEHEADRASEHAPQAPVVEETLVEEVSIDGMCGVY